MAEAQEKRMDETNSGQSNSQNDKNTQSTSSTGQITTKVENALGVEPGTTKDIYKQAKETAGQAFEKVSEKAATQIDEKKVTVARGLSSVAENIRQMGDNLKGSDQETPIADVTAKYSESLAKQVEQVSNYLETKDLRDVMRDVEGFARRNPAVFLGGAFALGLLVARFLKSSSDSSSSSGSNENLKRQSRFKSDGLHLPDNLEEQVKSSGSEPFKFEKTSPSASSPSDPAAGGI